MHQSPLQHPPCSFTVSEKYAPIACAGVDVIVNVYQDYFCDYHNIILLRLKMHMGTVLTIFRPQFFLDLFLEVWSDVHCFYKPKRSM